MVETRDRIISATNELFRAHGYNGTSLSQISKASGATIGSIYHFFPGGKEELTAAVIETTGAMYRELFELIVCAARDPLRGIDDFFVGAAETLLQTDFLDPCPIGTVAREVASTSSTLRNAADQVFVSWIDAVAEYLCGSGIEPAAARDLATLFVATVEGCFVLCRTTRTVEPLLVASRSLRPLISAQLERSPNIA